MILPNPWLSARFYAAMTDLDVYVGVKMFPEFILNH